MKTTITQNRCLASCLAIVAMLMMSLGVKAQNVTIRPDNGSLIVGQAGSQAEDSGIEKGLYAMWRHEQLALTMTTSDLALQTSAGELGDPSCGIGLYNNHLILAAGQTQTFVVVSLPKGFRITGYRLVLQPDLLGKDVKGQHASRDQFTLYHIDGNSQGPNTNNQNSYTKGSMAFYETYPWTSESPYGESTHSLQLTCSDARATATAADGDKVMDPATDGEKEFVIERTSKTESDMSNQLHFFFARSCSQYGVTIKSFEIWFTAQGKFEAEVAPTKSGEATDYVTSPFTTGKMDIGAVTWKEPQTITTGNPPRPKTIPGYYYYDYTGVRDLIAYTHLYQDNAVTGGKPAHQEGTDAPKNIYPLEIGGKNVYAFGNDTYFIEPPVEVSTATGNGTQPIGFRIVGAKFDYEYGTKQEAGTKIVPSTCQITCKGSNATSTGGSLSDNGGTTYYLNAELMFTTNVFNWEMDKLGNIGINLTTDYPQYLSCFGSDETRQLSLSTSANNQFNLQRNDEGNVFYYSDGNNTYRLYAQRFQEGTPYRIRGLVTRNANPPSGAVWATSTASNNTTVNIPAFTPGSYTLTVYGTDKSEPFKTVSVGEGDKGSFTVPNLNNDAVMFTVSNLASGKQALVNVTLIMEALNPYIDKMDIVCHDDINPQTQKPNLVLTQTFTASDFSVSGGQFIFYVPSGYSQKLLTFTFSDLYSKYGDDTYYSGTPSQKEGNARYSFVTSDYFKLYSGNQVSGVTGFPVNDGLYEDGKNDDGTSNDRTAYTPNSDYRDKVYTSTAGTVRFKFNNAEDLMSSTNNNLNRTLVEYPFSVTKYLSNYPDPDPTPEGQTQKTGSFEICQLMANPTQGYKHSGVYFVFTADETRYNIAPTTDWQHRSYAFYRMDIILESRSFNPDFTSTKIYDKTFYDKDGEDVTDSMWGVTLGVSDKDDQGNDLEGYFTYQEIYTYIMEGRAAILWQEGDQIPEGKNVGDVRVPAVPKLIDTTGKNGPKSMKEILYVDGSQLSSMLNSSEGETEENEIEDLSDFKNLLTTNALVFLPINTSSLLDNVVYKTSGGGFRAGKDIVLKDKQPFFSPYKIQVDASNKATYSREVSGPTTTLVDHATVVLPFGLDINKGKHTNRKEDGSPTPDGFAFNLRTLKVLNATEEQISNNNYYADGYFELYEKDKEEAKTVANQPYMVQVESGNGENKYSFIATQYGAIIEPTPTVTESTENGIGKTNFESEFESGVDIPDSSEELTSYGTYSGAKIPKSYNIYYFNKNKYVSSLTLKPSLTHVNARPFRAYYSPTDPANFVDNDNTTSSGAKMTSFNVVYELFSNDGGITTSLTETSKPRVMTITTSKGSMMITAAEDVPVKIMSANGLSVDSFNMNAGEQRQVNLPSGIYIVNNTKILVK